MHCTININTNRNTLHPQTGTHTHTSTTIQTHQRKVSGAGDPLEFPTIKQRTEQEQNVCKRNVKAGKKHKKLHINYVFLAQLHKSMVRAGESVWRGPCRTKAKGRIFFTLNVRGVADVEQQN